MGAAQSYVRGSLPERFWVKVDVQGDEDCWNWKASLDTKGYGNFGVPREDGTGRFVMKRAHRIAWELLNGPLDGSHVFLCHTCDNPKCVNPRHMFLGDHKANSLDCVAKGRLGDRKGKKNPRAKLTDEDVRNIRKSSLSLSALADLYKVAKSTVAVAKNGSGWKHL